MPLRCCRLPPGGSVTRVMKNHKGQRVRMSSVLCLPQERGHSGHLHSVSHMAPQPKQVTKSLAGDPYPCPSPSSAPGFDGPIAPTQMAHRPLHGSPCATQPCAPLPPHPRPWPWWPNSTLALGLLPYLTPDPVGSGVLPASPPTSPSPPSSGPQSLLRAHCYSPR